MRRNAPFCKSTIKRHALYIAALLAILGISNFSGQLNAQTTPLIWQADADLHDVYFHDAQTGWAVGSQGVILKTTDGGQTWKRYQPRPKKIVDDRPLEEKLRSLNQPRAVQRETPVFNDSLWNRYRLDSVHFVDSRHGWAAGGYELPYVQRTRAVILRTNDGGESWHSIDNLMLGRIREIQFGDDRNGWAIGDGGGLSTTGIAYTSDGGITWSTRTDGPWMNWKTAALAGEHFVALNRSGSLARIINDEFSPSVIKSNKSATIFDLSMTSSTTGWAIGNAGTVLETRDGGTSWTDAMVGEACEATELRTVTSTPGVIHFAGTPGTQVYSWNVTDKTFATVSTPSCGSIEKIMFADPQHGWAVGTQGCIIATDDGGRSWHSQRRPAASVAVMTISTSPDNVPLEMLARYGGEDGLVCASVVISTPQAADAIVQACEVAGATTTITIDRFAGEPFNSERIKNKVVQAIRTLKPRVVVCDAMTDRVDELADTAIRQSSNPAFAENFGLPHQVKRLGVIDGGGASSIDRRRTLVRMGSLLEDQIALPAGVLGRPINERDEVRYHVFGYLGRGNSLTKAPIRRELTASLNSLPKRAQGPSHRGTTDSIRQSAWKRDAFDQLVSADPQTPAGLLAWRTQMQQLTHRVVGTTAATWTVQLADRCASSGDPARAAIALQHVADYWPNHPLAPLAFTWLAHHFASDEMSTAEHQRLSGTATDITNSDTVAPVQDIDEKTVDGDLLDLPPPQVASYESKMTPVVLADGRTEYRWSRVPLTKATANDGVQTASYNTNNDAIMDAVSFRQQHLTSAARYFARLGSYDPALVMRDDYRMLQARIVREIGGSGNFESLYRAVIQSAATEPAIAKTAARELAIATGSSLTKVNGSTVNASQANQRPHLDGKFDDAFWQTAVQDNRVVRRTPNFDGGTNDKRQNPIDVGLFAWDSQNLYLIFRCEKSSTFAYPPTDNTRVRDADLLAADRIEICLDTDRSGDCQFCFSIDSRGRVHERCGQRENYDPQWFVAAIDDEESWTVECAIPLESITLHRSGSNDLHDLTSTNWALDIHRRVGGNAVDVWDEATEIANSAASNRQPGLLTGLFANDPQSTLIQFTSAPGERKVPDLERKNAVADGFPDVE